MRLCVCVYRLCQQQPSAGENFLERVRPDRVVRAGGCGRVPAVAAEEAVVTRGHC